MGSCEGRANAAKHRVHFGDAVAAPEDERAVTIEIHSQTRKNAGSLWAEMRSGASWLWFIRGVRRMCG